MTAEDLLFLEELTQARCGYGLRGDKAYFAESRLGGLARREGADSVTALLQRLRGDDERLCAAAAEALAVADTAFYRDGATFERLRSDVLPALSGRQGEQAVQVWSAGCSTGQEPYSLAMLAEEHSPAMRLDIVATDLSERVLEKAQSGLYTQFEVQRGLPIRMLLKHFDKVDEMWAISPRLRASVRWRQLNLIDNRPSRRTFDLILCRNVLSYFTASMREAVFARLLAALAPAGYLVLGAGEAPPAGLMDKGAGVFQRNDGARTAAAA